MWKFILLFLSIFYTHSLQKFIFPNNSSNERLGSYWIVLTSRLAPGELFFAARWHLSKTQIELQNYSKSKF